MSISSIGPVERPVSDDVVEASVSVTNAGDVEAVRLALETWTHTRLGLQTAKITRFETPNASGSSSELFLASITGLEDAASSEVVVRLRSEFDVYPVVDLALQVRCMEAARKSGAPVPEVLWYELDASFLGRAFYVMRRCSGRIPSDYPSYVTQGWLHDLAPDARQDLWKNGVRAIAGVHATDISSQDLRQSTLPVEGVTPLDRALNYWDLYRELLGREWDLPIIDRAIAFLRDEQPAGPFAPALVWGDASLRNMMFEGTTPSALLDFEFSHVGLREFDVAFYSLMDRVVAEAFGKVPRLSGFLEEDDTFDFYEEITGYRIIDRNYFTIMASTYNTLAVTRVFQNLHRKELITKDEVINNPAAMFLKSLL